MEMVFGVYVPSTVFANAHIARFFKTRRVLRTPMDVSLRSTSQKIGKVFYEYEKKLNSARN